MISTSCHIDQKDKLVLAPVLPLDSFSGNLKELKKNTIFDYMYISDVQLTDRFIDFSVLGSYSKELILEGLRRGNIERKASLNQMGYYLFIVKLSVYLMRKEDGDTLSERKKEMSGV